MKIPPKTSHMLQRLPVSALVIFIFLSASFPLTAATYSGRVVDAETGRGAGGVAISLQPSTGQTVSDSTGAFSLTAFLSVRNGSVVSKAGPVLRYLPQRDGISINLAKHEKSLEIYSVHGRCVATTRCAPANDIIPLNALAHGLYLLRLRTAQQTYTFVWNHTGAQQCIIPRVLSANSRRLARAAAAPMLLFEKSGYQQKKVQVVADSDYADLRVAIKPNIGDYLFNEDTVRTYRLYLSESEIARLLDFNALVSGYTVNTVWVTARLVFEDRAFDSIAVRFRGDQSIWDCVSGGARRKNVRYPQYGFGNGDVCSKFAMKFDFNRIVPDQRLYGLKALNFRSMSFDPTKMHERLGFSLYHDMGIHAPRAAYANLYVNDSLWGLFCAVEEIDGRFTKSRYPLSGDGNLYKEAWPDEATSESLLLSFSLVTNNDPADNPNVDDFLAFRDSVIAGSTDSSNFLDKIGRVVDIPNLVRYLAVDRGIGNFDGIVSAYVLSSSLLRHNYFWYHNQETGLFELIPWDLDKALLFPEPNFWSNNQPEGNNQLPNWNVINSSYSPVLCTFDPGPFNGYFVVPIDSDKFLKLVRTATWSQFTAQCRRFLDSCFTQAKVDSRVETWRRQIAPAVGLDPTIDSAEWSIMVDSLKHTIPLMRTNLELMIDTLISR
jgi:hypothetical protein